MLYSFKSLKVRILEGTSEFNEECMSFRDRGLYLLVGFSGEKPSNNNNKNYIKN